MGSMTPAQQDLQDIGQSYSASYATGLKSIQKAVSWASNIHASTP